MPDTPIAATDPTPSDPRLEARVTRLETDVGDMKSVLGQLVPMLVRIETMLSSTLPHLATKAELADLRTEMHTEIGGLRSELHTEIAGVRGEVGDLRAEMHTEIGSLRADLADKPGKVYLWGVMTALVASYAAGLAALAVLK
jgi:hypothetical protein